VALGAGVRTFPVGNATTYTPAYIDNAGTTNMFKVRVFSNIYENGIAGAVIQNIEASVKKTWEIAPTTNFGAPNVSINLQWNLADEGAGFAAVRSNSSLPYIGKNTGVGNSTWAQQIVSAGNFAAEPFSITTPSILTFSKFAVGSLITPLPVSMGNLSVHADSKTNKLVWDTYSEVNSKGFSILRSTNGKDFTTVGYVNAAGNSSQKRSYTFSDKASASRVYYQVKFEGTAAGDVSYSNIVTVAPGTKADFRMYPNPTQGIVLVEGEETDTEDKLTFRLTDISGKQHLVTPSAYASHGQTLDLTTLPAGIYTVEKIQNGEVVGKARVIKQ
jgi:hypothetical protein